MGILRMILTALLSVAALFLITKCMGHKQVAQLDFFDYVCGITIGSIGAELATELEKPARPLIALLIYGLVSTTLNLLAHKCPKTRKYINGTPTLLMSEGRLYRANLKKAKLDLSEFMLLCREQGYFDPEEIWVAVLEHNGKLSVLPRAASRPLTPQDMRIPAQQAHVGVELIMDGRVMGENLSRIGRDGAWLTGELRARGYTSAREILLGIYHPEQERFVLYKNEG